MTGKKNWSSSSNYIYYMIGKVLVANVV